MRILRFYKRPYRFIVAVLSHLNRNVTPLKWAQTQHHVSNALRIRGELDPQRGQRWLLKRLFPPLV